MSTRIVRLHERPDGLVHALERSDEELARAASIGGVVVDVTLALPVQGRTLAVAMDLLRVSRREVAAADDPKGWGVVEVARRCVAPIELPAVAPAPSPVVAARDKVERAKASLAAAHDELAQAEAEVTRG